MRKAEALQLTDEQVAQVAALKEQHMEERQAGREERKAAFEAILTADQLAILNAHRESREEGAKSRGTRPDLGLSADQQAALTALREQHRGSGQVARDEFRAAFEAILTPEQLDILEELKASRAGHRGDKSAGEEEGTATDTAAALQLPELADDGAPTVIGETSWGLIKERHAP